MRNTFASALLVLCAATGLSGCAVPLCEQLASHVCGSDDETVLARCDATRAATEAAYEAGDFEAAQREAACGRELETVRGDCETTSHGGRSARGHCFEELPDGTFGAHHSDTKDTGRDFGLVR